MKYSIDSSVYINDQIALGFLTGYVNLLSTPAIGSNVSFSPPLNPCGLKTPFNTILKIENITHNSCIVYDVVASLEFENFIFSSIEDATETMKYFVKGFDFCFECFDEEYYEKNKDWLNPSSS
jgi:hypothetical protein